MVVIHNTTKKFEWDSMEVEHAPKSTDWYWGLGIIAITIIILSIVSKNYLLALLTAAGAMLIGWHANDVPAPIHVELSEHGIKLGRDMYPYESIKSFWIYTDHKDRVQLMLVTGRAVVPERSLPLPESISPTEIREYLLDFVEEKETKPSQLSLLAESLGL